MSVTKAEIIRKSFRRVNLLSPFKWNSGIYSKHYVCVCVQHTQCIVNKHAFVYTHSFGMIIVFLLFFRKYLAFAYEMHERMRSHKDDNEDTRKLVSHHSLHRISAYKKFTFLFGF